MRSIRSSAVAGLFAFLVIGAGCYESLISIVTPDKLVFDEGLLGEYRLSDPAEGSVTIAKGQKKGYTFEQFDKDGKQTSKGTLHVIKLDREYFYELTASGFRTVDDKPIFVIGRLVIERDGDAGPAKSLTGFSFQSKEKFLDDPEVTTADYEYDEHGERKQGRAVNMPAERLQAFLAATAGKMTHQELRLERTSKAK